MGDDPRGGGALHEFDLAPGLASSLQRYPLTGSASLHEQPRSWGALPLAVAGPGRVLVPAPEGEGVWLGLLPERHGPVWRVQVVALLSPHGATDAVSGLAVGQDGEAAVIEVPPHRALPGIRRDDGAWWALTRTAPEPGAPSCRHLTVLARPAGRPAADAGPSSRISVRIDLVAPADFEEDTGIPVPPLRPDAPYGGRRLP